MRKFWKRIKLVFTIKKFGPFLLDFYKSTTVPAKKKFLSLAFMAGYLLFPFDAIPDFLTGFGLLDDAAVLLFVLQQIIKLAPASLRDKHDMRHE
ncbi:YkvA family protein [Bacillus sp. B-jedd]|uniref:YkvA family protein n=1 Tax=Bacillus sp. B-jedd TaxID=1476857 RepID=UPI0005156185|nr:DUF1232 domain-containing protein [Bacillus sp. B-jedd]CEG27327.1 Hypothetical protein BN1002_02187 [Bacillus sp. B-jedd]